MVITGFVAVGVVVVVLDREAVARARVDYPGYLRVRPGLSRHCMSKRRFIQVWLPVTSPRLYVHRLVERDAVDPRADFRFSPKRRERMMNFQKHLLHHVLCLTCKALPENRKCQTKCQLAMAPKQFRKGVLIAALRASHELGIAMHRALTAGIAFQEMEGKQAHTQKGERQG